MSLGAIIHRTIQEVRVSKGGDVDLGRKENRTELAAILCEDYDDLIDPTREESLDGPDLESLDAMRSLAEGWKQAATAVLGALDDLMAAGLEDGGKVRFGETFYSASKPSTFRLREGQERAFWDRLWASGTSVAMQVFNPNGAKVTGLRKVDAELRDPSAIVVDPETGEILPPEKRGSIFDYFETEIPEDAPEKLKAVPVSKAAKYVATLPEGSVRYGRGKGKTREELDAEDPSK